MHLVAMGALVLALSCGLAGCEAARYMDPYAAPGQWHPLGANSANLRAMVADPRDLEVGRAATGSSGDIAAAAVARLRTDVVKRMPPSAISEMRASDTAPQQGGQGEGPTPAAPVAPSVGPGVAQ